MALARERKFSPEEYLTLERQAAVKSEFVDGTVMAMAGRSAEHDTIVGNLGARLHAQLRGTSCRVFTSNMKVRTDASGLFAYPDLTVVCGEVGFHDPSRDVVTNPKVIFEVLSPSTEAFDRGKKRIRYQTVETLTDYCLIAQDEARVEHWTRQPDGRWLVSASQGLDGTLELVSIGCTLPLAELYERVNLDATPAT